MTDFETELSQAMRDYADRPTPPASDVVAIRRRVRRRRNTLLATTGTAIVVAAAVCAAALALPHDAAAPAPPVQHRPTPAPGPTFTDAELLDAMLPATGAQTTAGERIGAVEDTYRAQVAAACVGPSAYPLRYTSSGQLNEVHAANMPDLVRIAQTHEVGSVRATQPAPMSTAQRARYQSCTNTVLAETNPLAGALGALTESWGGEIARIQVSAPVARLLPAFRACAVRAGAPASSLAEGDPVNDFVRWIDVTALNHTTAQAVRVQREWSAKFVTCARPVVAEREKLQLAAQATFEQQHASEIRTALGTVRTELAKLAAKYPWHGYVAVRILL